MEPRFWKGCSIFCDLLWKHFLLTSFPCYLHLLYFYSSLGPARKGYNTRNMQTKQFRESDYHYTVLAKHEILITFSSAWFWKDMYTYLQIHASHAHLIFSFLGFFFFFGTGICKLEKEILSLQLPGDSSSNWYFESPVGEKNIVEGKHLLM